MAHGAMHHLQKRLRIIVKETKINKNEYMYTAESQGKRHFNEYSLRKRKK